MSKAKNTEIIIKPIRKWQLVDLGELWRYRELFFTLTWRDIKVRYKQTFLGVVWVIFQPITTAGIFTVFFGRLAKIPSGNIPYELFVLIGLVFWIFFSSTLSHASNSLVENLNIIKKVYFPREILPISSVVTGLADFFINFAVVLVAGFYFGFKPSFLTVIILPICIIITCLTSAGIGLFLASLNIKYRDVRYILPFFIQTLMFVTPVIYPLSTVRDSFRHLLGINPMAGVIESMRVVLGESGKVDYLLLSISGSSALVFLVFGVAFFKFTEKFFADIA